MAQWTVSCNFQTINGLQNEESEIDTARSPFFLRKDITDVMMCYSNTDTAVGGYDNITFVRANTKKKKWEKGFGLSFF